MRALAMTLVEIAVDASDAFDGDEREGRAVVVDAQRDAVVAADGLSLDRVDAGREDHVVAVEHEPDRDDVRGPAPPGHRQLGRAGSRAQERPALLVGHVDSHGRTVTSLP